jgi:hypothetical protein
MWAKTLPLLDALTPIWVLASNQSAAGQESDSKSKMNRAEQ